MLLKTLENKNNEVYTGYVNIGNNEDAMLMEKDARGLLRKDIQKIIKQNQKQYKGIWRYKNRDYELNTIYSYDFQDFYYGQLPIFINAIINCIYNFNEIQMGYVNNDYNNVKGFTKRVKDIYNSYIRLQNDETIEPIVHTNRNWKCAKLKFPLVNTTKVDEILYLYNLDQIYGTNLLTNTVHCNFGFNWSDCICFSCQNYKKAYRKAMDILKWN